MNFNPVQAFKLDHIFWTKKEYEIAQQFVQYNSLLNKLYQSIHSRKLDNDHINKSSTSEAKRKQKEKQSFQKSTPNDIDQIIKMVYYTKIEHNKNFLLQGNKKPHAVILLSGQINILKTGLSLEDIKFCQSKNYKKKRYQKKLQEALPVSLGSYMNTNDTIIIDSDCKIIVEQNLNYNEQQKRPAEILFIPFKVYQQFNKKSFEKKSQQITQYLLDYFKNINKKEAIKLAQYCQFQKISIGNYIYKIGQTPENVYLLLEGKFLDNIGTIKIESLNEETGMESSFSNYSENNGKTQNKYKSSIVSSTTIFGDLDINFFQRKNNALANSATAQMIAIPKKQYFRISKNPLFLLPDVSSRKSSPLHFFQRKSQSPIQKPRLAKLGELRLQKIVSSPEKDQLPILNSARSIPKFEQEIIEKKLFRNSHAMMQVAGVNKMRGNFSIRSPKKQLIDNSEQISDPYAGKFSLYQKIRPNPIRFDINNRLF